MLNIRKVTNILKLLESKRFKFAELHSAVKQVIKEAGFNKTTGHKS